MRGECSSASIIKFNAGNFREAEGNLLQQDLADCGGVGEPLRSKELAYAQIAAAGIVHIEAGGDGAEIEARIFFRGQGSVIVHLWMYILAPFVAGG